MTDTTLRVEHDKSAVRQCPFMAVTHEVCIEHGVCRHHGCHLAQRCPHGTVNALIRLTTIVEELEREIHAGRPTGRSVS